MSPQRVVLFKTDLAFLMAHRFLVFPNGVEFSLDLRLRHPDEDRHDLPWELHGRRRHGPLPDDFLRLGVLLSDGTKWTNLDWPPGPPDGRTARPVVMFRGGGGGRHTYDLRYWMWPLPPPGPLTVVCEWPAYGVPETRVVVDATELRAHAADAEAIWPE